MKLLTASQWKPGVGTTDIVWGIPGVTSYCEVITSGAVGVGPFRVVAQINVVAGGTTAGGNVAAIEFVEAPGEHNAFARLSISKDQNPAIYLTGDTNSAGVSICYGEDRPGVTRIDEGITYAIFEWSGYEGVSSDKVLKFTRFA